MSELPVGWTPSQLGDLARRIRGVTYRKEEARTTFSAGYVPVLRATNFDETGLHLDRELVFVPEERIAPEQWLQPGDVLVASSSGSSAVVGKSARFVGGWEGAFGAFCTVLRPNAEVDSKYIAFAVSREPTRRRWSELASGTNINNLKGSHFAETPIPLPPLAEQRRIVAAIEEQFSRLDGGCSTLILAQRRLRILRRLALKSAFEGLPDQRLGDVAEVAGGHTPRGLQSTPNGTIPFFKVGDMNSADEDGRMAAARTYLSSEAAHAYRARLWPSGTVIFPKQGGAIATNKKRVLATTAACDLNTMGVIPSAAIDPRFAKAWFETIDLSSLSDGSVVAQIKPSRVANLRVPLPLLEEQRRIVAELEQQLSLIDSLRAAVESAQKRSAALRRTILERAFRGELVPQDPADEPASVLLERIRAERAAAPVRPSRRRATMETS